MSKTRICSKCGETKPLNEEYFQRNQSTNTGGNKYWRPECKECQKKASKCKAHAKRAAGNPGTPPLGTPCDLCNRTDKLLCFDHDHTTCKHRGWLCDNCNRSLGMLGDSVEALERAIRYLKSRNLDE